MGVSSYLYVFMTVVVVAVLVLSGPKWEVLMFDR